MSSDARQLAFTDAGEPVKYKAPDGQRFSSAEGDDAEPVVTRRSSIAIGHRLYHGVLVPMAPRLVPDGGMPATTKLAGRRGAGGADEAIRVRGDRRWVWGAICRAVLVPTCWDGRSYDRTPSAVVRFAPSGCHQLGVEDETAAVPFTINDHFSPPAARNWAKRRAAAKSAVLMKGAQI